MSLWDSAKSLSKFTPVGMAYNVAKNGQLFGKEGPSQAEKLDSAMSKGKREGLALGNELMSDKDLVASRQNYKDLAAQYSPSADMANQQASQAVKNMRYKGANLSPLQQMEAQRQLSGDLGKQQFEQSRQAAQDIYKMDLDKSKFLGSMAMGGQQMAMAGVEPEKGMISSLLGGLF